MSISHKEMVKGIVPKPNRRARRRIAKERGNLAEAASYARFSSEKQSEKSNDDQHRECKQAAETNDHQILARRRYSDEEVSGTKPDREGLNQLLEDAENGEISVIYFHNLSRLARESLISMSILKRLVNVYGVRFISVIEGIDSDRQGWEMAAQVVSIFHERYLQQLAADVLRGQAGNVLAGLSVGDHRFGYDSVEIEDAAPRGRNKKPPKQYVINKEQANWVRQIFTWYADDKLSLSQIVRNLNTLAVPKCHRAKVAHWSHSNVVSILESPKYVGVWSWGLLKNHRDPETGEVWQEPRDEDEFSKDWIRFMEELQIVEVSQYEAVQDRLRENREKDAKFRNSEGKFNAARGSKNNPPKHLVSGLMYCANCGHKLYIGGTNGKYLFCPNYPRGLCSLKTRLHKEIATEKIALLVEDAIAYDAEWLGMTFRSTLQTWETNESKIPGQIGDVEKQIAATEQKIERLIDRIEDGNDEVTLNRRLKKRESELVDLQVELRNLNLKMSEKVSAPTEEWVKNTLEESISWDGSDFSPAEISAIHSLLGGKIVVEEVVPENGKPYLIGHANLAVSDATKFLVGDRLNVDDSDDANFACEIDFRPPHPLLEKSEKAKSLYDLGMMNIEIKDELGISKSMVTKLIRFWFESRGMEMPDGRTRRSQLKKKHTETPYYQRIADPVQALLDDGLLIRDVADVIGCDINTVRSASQHWHSERGLEYQDGRSRRKTLDQKVSQKI